MKCYSRLVFAHPLYGFTFDVWYFDVWYFANNLQVPPLFYIFASNKEFKNLCCKKKNTVHPISVPTLSWRINIVFFRRIHCMAVLHAKESPVSIVTHPLFPCRLGKRHSILNKNNCHHWKSKIIKWIQARYLHPPKNWWDVHSKWSLKSTCLQLQHICLWPPPATNFPYNILLCVYWNVYVWIIYLSCTTYCIYKTMYILCWYPLFCVKNAKECSVNSGSPYLWLALHH